MPFVPSKPYNDLPLLPPNADIETKAVLKACIEARVALAELKQAGKLIPNQAVLINTIPLLEAQSSSEIENVITTADRLFQHAQQDADADPATKEALRYRTALRQGFEELKTRPLATATAVRICATIKAVDMNIRRTPGTTLINEATGNVIYTPPEGEARLRDLLANWEKYLHEARSTDPAIRMAIQHYQFEAIHPFTDGNGRTGRVLNLLFLVDQGLLDLPVLYLSRAILQRRSEYYNLLLDVTTKERWEPWTLFMLAAVTETARWSTAKVMAVHDLLGATAAFVSKEAPRIYSRELIELLFEQPYCRIANIVDVGLAHRETASTHLRRLTDMGVLKEIRRGREKLFLNPRLLALLTRDSNHFTAFEPAHAGRRSQRAQGKA